MEKKGQVTLFVIIALIIVVSGTLVFTLSGGIRSLSDAENNPRLFLKDCVEDTLENFVYNASMNGGSLNPEFYHDYYGSKVEYLCSASRNYASCVVQRPFIQQYMEEELTKAIEPKLMSCIDALEDNFKGKNFQVSSEFKGYNVSILPKRISLNVNYDLSLVKTETNRYSEFTINLNNNLYELVGVARSIIEWETLLGDAEIKEYSAIYHDLDIRKNRVEDEVKIYTIEDRRTKDKFQFATRSFVFPPGLN